MKKFLSLFLFAEIFLSCSCQEHIYSFKNDFYQRFEVSSVLIDILVGATIYVCDKDSVVMDQPILIKQLETKFEKNGEHFIARVQNYKVARNGIKSIYLYDPLDFDYIDINWKRKSYDSTIVSSICTYQILQKDTTTKCLSAKHAFQYTTFVLSDKWKPCY